MVKKQKDEQIEALKDLVVNHQAIIVDLLKVVESHQNQINLLVKAVKIMGKING